MDAELLCDKECIICLDNKEKEWITLDCRHEYHKTCIYNWMRIRMICPICIRAIQPPCEEIVEHIPNASDANNENNDIREYCPRSVLQMICALFLLACLCILIGSILAYLYH